jgi:hypothetical protein
MGANTMRRPSTPDATMGLEALANVIRIAPRWAIALAVLVARPSSLW